MTDRSANRRDDPTPEEFDPARIEPISLEQAGAETEARRRMPMHLRNRRGMTRREALFALSGAAGATALGGGTVWMMSGDGENGGAESGGEGEGGGNVDPNNASQNSPDKTSSSNDLFSNNVAESEAVTTEQVDKEQEKSDARAARADRAKWRRSAELHETRNGIWEFSREMLAQPTVVASISKTLTAAQNLGAVLIRRQRAGVALQGAHDQPGAQRADVTNEVQNQMDILAGWQNNIATGEVPVTALTGLTAAIWRIVQLATRDDASATHNVVGILGTLAGAGGVGYLLYRRMNNQGGAGMENVRQINPVRPIASIQNFDTTLPFAAPDADLVARGDTTDARHYTQGGSRLRPYNWRIATQFFEGYRNNLNALSRQISRDLPT